MNVNPRFDWFPCSHSLCTIPESCLPVTLGKHVSNDVREFTKRSDQLLGTPTRDLARRAVLDRVTDTA